MVIKSVVDALLGLLNPTLPALEPQGLLPAGPRLGRQAFDSRLRLFADRDVDGADPLLAGSLELVGIEDLRQALGDDWPAIADRAREVAELELQMQLGPSDIYRLHSDSLFLVCFATLDQQKAEVKAREIAANIRASLIEHLPELGEALRVDHFVAKIEREAFKDPTIPVADSLLAALKKVRAEAEAVPQQFNFSTLRGASLTFYPAWHPANRMLAFNRCSFDLTASGTELARFRALADGPKLDQVTAQLDFLLLTRSVEALHAALANGRAGVHLLVPVAYSTIAGASSLAEYSDLLALIPAPYRKSVVLEISGAPLAITPQFVAKMMKSLKSFVGGVAIELLPGSVHAQQIVGLGPWGVAIDLQNRAIRQQSPSALETILSTARLAGVNTMAHGANSLAMATACARAGFTYVDGPAIHAMTREPKRISPLNPLQKQRSGYPGAPAAPVAGEPWQAQSFTSARSNAARTGR